MSDAVNHPAHYASGKIEVIEFIEDQGMGEAFCLGNAIKYISRAGKKDPTKELEDLEKAAWYLNRRIEVLRSTWEGRTPIRPNDMNPKTPKSESSGVKVSDQNWRTVRESFDQFASSATDASNSESGERQADTAESAVSPTVWGMRGEWAEITKEEIGMIAFIPEETYENLRRFRDHRGLGRFYDPKEEVTP